MWTIGSPQWRQQYESSRVFAEDIKHKLSDPRQYLADRMGRADDAAMLQYVENIIESFELEERLLKNPPPEEVAEINKRLEAFAATQTENFAFLQRLGVQQNARFEQAKKLAPVALNRKREQETVPRPPAIETQPAPATPEYQSLLKRWTHAALTTNRKFNNLEIREYMGEKGPDELKDLFRDKKTNSSGSIVRAYNINAKHRSQIKKAINKVRGDMKLPAPK